MIVLQHDFKKIIKVSRQGEPLAWNSNQSIGQKMYALAQKFPNEIITWSHIKVSEAINWEYCQKTVGSNRMMQSYNPFGNYMTDIIGYIEESPFININKKVKYPTWQMSSVAGCMATNTIIQTNQEFWKDSDFDYCLNGVAKAYQPLGLFCYSNPNLLKAPIELASPQASLGQTFRFVKQHYKAVWVYLLFLNLFLYERKIPLGSVLKTLFIHKKRTNQQALIFNESEREADYSIETIDVIIPTIGRKKYLYDVLCDLKVQTHLPIQVIVVEQNPLPDSKSELDYIENEDWPFIIKHIFTHQSGACNARNIALKEVKSKWVFLADDDIRFDTDLFQKVINKMYQYRISVLTTSCLQPNEIQHYKMVHQSGIFGSGTSFVKTISLSRVRFDKALEFGYGEDTDFGLQLRNKGVDIIYVPDIVITHLKAPMGGFRTKFVHPWESDILQPKPSPTVLYVKNKFYSQSQILGYKTILFLKLYKYQIWKLYIFNRRWNSSKKWANSFKKNTTY